MYYASEVGKRLPVPLFQSAMTLGALLVVWRVERFVERRASPRGLVAATAVAIWGAGRLVEEHFWLARPGPPGDVAVEVAGVALAAAGTVVAALLVVRAAKKPGMLVAGD